MRGLVFCGGVGIRSEWDVEQSKGQSVVVVPAPRKAGRRPDARHLDTAAVQQYKASRFIF